MTTVRYDTKHQKISVVYDFNFGAISNVKIIASCKEWLDFLQAADFYRMSFDFIKSHLSRPTQGTLELLSNYAENSPDDFSFDAFECAQYANSINPLFNPKPRKPSAYELDQQARNEIAAQAAYLYVLLKNMSELPEKQWPDYFKRFCKAYDILPVDLKGNLDRQDTVRKILSIYIDGDDQYFGERFFKTFVTESPVKLARIKKSSRISPTNNPFLEPIFKEFI